MMILSPKILNVDLMVSIHVGIDLIVSVEFYSETGLSVSDVNLVGAYECMYGKVSAVGIQSKKNINSRWGVRGADPDGIIRH